MNWISKHKRGIIRGAFLVPILAVAIISISHVVSWYDLSNPMSWAIYLSVAVEIAAMAALAAASVRVKGASVWLVFGIVTLIQFIGNIFFCYKEINVNDPNFIAWIELTGPLFESMGSDITDVISQKRWLAVLEGGLLPLISLTCLHFFIRYGDMDDEKEIKELEKELIVSSEEDYMKEELVVDNTPLEESVLPTESAPVDVENNEKKK